MKNLWKELRKIAWAQQEAVNPYTPIWTGWKKELRKRETWWSCSGRGLSGLAPWIACAIVLLFFPNGYGLLIIFFIYLTVKFWHDTKDLHKRE